MNAMLCVSIITVPNKQTCYAKHCFTLHDIEQQIFTTRAEYAAAAKMKGLKIATAKTPATVNGSQDGSDSNEPASLNRDPYAPL
jgi:hypothetical protein